jgi:hypothetical protein
VGPDQHVPNLVGAQAPECAPRSRTCLLKGCERSFRPSCALQDYCSERCREAARRWSVFRAQQRYRASEQGKETRRQQSRRYRRRQREARRSSPTKVPGSGFRRAREGHHKRTPGKKIWCDRPGCYARFRLSARSPRRRFCCTCCRKALRRARERRKRWRNHCAFCPFALLADAVLGTRPLSLSALY